MKPRRKRKWLKWTLGTLAVLLGAGLYATWDVWKACLTLNGEYKAARREGALLTHDEVVASLQRPKELDGAPLLLKACEVWSDLPARVRTTLSQSLAYHLRQKGASVQNVLLGRDALRRELRPFLQLADELDAKSEFVFPWADQFDYPLYNASGLRLLNRALCLEAEAQVSEGNLPEAARRYAQALHATEVLGKGQSGFLSMLRFSQQTQTMASLQRVALLNVENPKVLQMAQKVSTEFKPYITPENLFRRDVLAINDFFESNKLDTYRDDPCVLIPFWYRSPPVLLASRTRAIQWMREVNHAFQVSNGDLDVFIQTAKEIDRTHKDGYDGLSGGLLNMLLGPLSMHTDGAQRMLVNRELTLATLDVIAFRQKNQKWPATLPVSRIDRFSKQTFRYELREGKPVLWSVGPNGKDDGGIKSTTTPPKHATDDIIIDFEVPPLEFTVPKAPPREDTPY